jgi:two-component system, NarL family, nitrate/nitrite response regulator NarL
MPTSSTDPIRVLLIDDHVVMRKGLRMLIETQPGMRVVGEATDRDAAMLSAAREQPDIILLDLDLGNESGLDILPELRTAAKGARVIVLTGIRDPAEHRQAVRLGATGMVLKEQALDTLVQAIERVYAGETWLDPALVANVLSDRSRTRGSAANFTAADIAALTEREHEVIALIGEGLKNRQIGERLSISETTVVHHLTSIFAKLGVVNRLELVTYAYRHGLTKPH